MRAGVAGSAWRTRRMRVQKPRLALGLAGVLLVGSLAWADEPGEAPALGDRITQEMVESLSLNKARIEGRRIFSTPFNQHDGLGDGPMNPADAASPGGRPTLGNNGMFLRLNGLDSQTCLECHNVLSSAEIPATFAAGGAGGAVASAFPGVLAPDIADAEGNGFAAMSGRMINPPFVFGAGGVELLGKEMTAELQELKGDAQANPGTVVELVTKGVSFGSIVFEGGAFDTSGLEGVDEDLVVRPFGRKGCCATVREFAKGAFQFHHGIQPVELVGAGADPDGDGIANELLVGELSALHVWGAALETPQQRGKTNRSRSGRALFHEIGCADCHLPELHTTSRFLTLSFPEVPTDPNANVFFNIDLSRDPPGFRRAGTGVRVPLYADLKRHDMGAGLAENTGSEFDAHFTTARLWGVADTAPYLHDGRATTLTQAILLHGGEAESARDIFDTLLPHERKALLAFLRTLRVPQHPNHDRRR